MVAWSLPLMIEFDPGLRRQPGGGDPVIIKLVSVSCLGCGAAQNLRLGAGLRVLQSRTPSRRDRNAAADRRRRRGRRRRGSAVSELNEIN
jgi:hypothetical protein